MPSNAFEHYTEDEDLRKWQAGCRGFFQMSGLGLFRNVRF
jgi:hypothetical protein